MKKTLAEIARDMRALAIDEGKATASLTRGLSLELYHRLWQEERLWTLLLERDDVAPSPVEIRTCRIAFAVPEDASEMTTNRLVSICWLEALRMVAPAESHPVMYQEAFV